MKKRPQILPDYLPDRVQVGDRLRRTRLALNYENMSEFARTIGLNRNTWGQYELGERLIPVQVVNALYMRFGVTFDWVYRADAQGLPKRIADTLRAA